MQIATTMPDVAEFANPDTDASTYSDTDTDGDFGFPDSVVVYQGPLPRRCADCRRTLGLDALL
eukprot:11376425-Alexandrium_andersonii.AAC.1